MIRVPFIIRAPNLPEDAIGKVIEGQVRSVDIAPHEEFFDLQKDPKEQINLIDRLKYHAPK